MSPDERKEIVRRMIAMWTTGTSAKPADILAETYRNHQAPSLEGGTKILDRAGFEQLMASIKAAFTASDVKIMAQVAEGDLVATHWQVTATQTGEFIGIAPTGKQVTWTGMQIDRFDGGKIAETWINWDMYGFLYALGAVGKP